MLFTARGFTQYEITQEDFNKIRVILYDEKIVPALFHTHHAFSAASGISIHTILDAYMNDKSAYRSRRLSDTLFGDIFFDANDVFYILKVGEERVFEYENGEPVLKYHKQDGLEFGVISSSNDKDQNDKLYEFYEYFKAAVERVIDGRKRRYWDLQLKPEPHDQPLEQVLGTTEPEHEFNFQFANYTHEEQEAAKTLKDPQARDLARTISQAGFVREQELLQSGKKKGQHSKEVVERLTGSGLVRGDSLVQCKKTSAPLARILNEKSLEEAGSDQMSCPNCGALFKDELLTTGYALSELGRQMLQASHWMTLVVTRELNSIGIPNENIAWNVTDKSEEIDLIVNCLGERWIFELKDREFGPGDAHPLNYRRARYRARKAIIVTTDKVSKDAKKVLNDLSRDSDRSQKDNIVYIEGLEQLPKKLQTEAANATLRQASRRLRKLADLSGYNIPELVEKHFNQEIEE